MMGCGRGCSGWDARPFGQQHPAAEFFCHVIFLFLSDAFQELYGGGYGHVPQMFNAYGQSMGTFIPPHMPMYQPGSSEMLPASIQLRLDQLAGTGFCHPGEIDDRQESKRAREEIIREFRRCR